MYQTIPRKYRPQKFGAIVGQEAIVTTLKNALKLGRTAHAYLFCGSRGTGKTTLARLFAKALNCHNLSTDQEPCNTCPSCLEITAGKSLDVLEVDGASNRGIDDIRQINETVGYATSSGKYKIYIIDEVHMLTKEAFNALLKTLEEPPPNVKFLFATTEPHKVLPTIISRCQRFDLHRIGLEPMRDKLQQICTELGVTAHKEALELIAYLAEGGLRDAESLLDQLICYTEGPITLDAVTKTLGLSSKAVYFQLDQEIAAANFAFAFELAQDVFAQGKDLSSFLDGLLGHFRIHLLFKLNQTPHLSDQDRNTYLQQSSHYTEEQILYILDYLLHWQKEVARTPFKKITLEMILLHLIRSKNRIALPTLVKRLMQLESPHSDSPPQPKEVLEEKLLTALKKPPASKLPEEKPALPPQLEQATIAERQGASENKHSEAKPTQSKTDSSSCFGIDKNRCETLLHFAAVELEGTLKRN
jgi:DNA polymerase-3 subunit gamma/tau